MGPAVKSLSIVRTCALRPRPAMAWRSYDMVNRVKLPVRSFATDKSRDLTEAPETQADGDTTEPADHITEQAIKMAKMEGREGPDLSQATSVQEVLKNDNEARKQAPQVVEESIQAGDVPKPSTTIAGKRSFSTMARRRQEVLSDHTPANLDPSMLPSEEQRAEYTAVNPSGELPADGPRPGHLFPLPELPLPPGSHKDHRYDPVVTQFVGLLMRDGKKATAQRLTSKMLDILRTSPAPKFSPTRPLLPGAPPASHLRLDPVQYLTLAVDSIAPLLRIRSQKGAAGGGVALQIPVALSQRQRRRVAMTWIIDTAAKRPAMGAGHDLLAKRLAAEVQSVIEGRSAIWDRRQMVHKLATAARINLRASIRR